MSKEEIAELEKAVSKAKFVMSQKASDLHDLIEDRLLTDFKDIPAYADDAYKTACQWDELRRRLDEAKKG